MQRRKFITLLGGAAAAWPLAARAQQPKMPVIGCLSSGSADVFAGRMRALRQGLSEAGYVEGRNVAIDYRWAGDQYDRLPVLAADLVRQQVNVIGAFGGSLGAQAAKFATTIIPIVFATGDDPVANGLVASLNRPGGNLTGVSLLGGELWPKRLEVVGELVPATTIIAVLVNPTRINAETMSRDLQAAARTLGRQIQVLYASNEREIDEAFANLVQLRVGALVIGTDAFFNSRSDQLATLALRHAVPAIYQYQDFTAAGGLMSYGGSITDAYRLVGNYIGRILKGEKPADLPVQQSTKIELIINMKTAKALGLTFPITLLGRADEVIE
jgi:putative ABC transport system substrate-binding protein